MHYLSWGESPVEKSDRLWEKVVEAIKRMMAVNTEYHLAWIAQDEFVKYFDAEPSYVRLLDYTAVAARVFKVEEIPDVEAKKYATSVGAKYVVLETIVFEREGYCKNENTISPIVFSEVTREEDTYCVVHRIKLAEKLEW